MLGPERDENGGGSEENQAPVTRELTWSHRTGGEGADVDADADSDVAFELQGKTFDDLSASGKQI